MYVCDVLQAKPFAVLPGSGMALEVSLKTSDKVGPTCIREWIML